MPTIDNLKEAGAKWGMNHTREGCAGQVAGYPMNFTVSRDDGVDTIRFIVNVSPDYDKQKLADSWMSQPVLKEERVTKVNIELQERFASIKLRFPEIKPEVNRLELIVEAMIAGLDQASGKPGAVEGEVKAVHGKPVVVPAGKGTGAEASADDESASPVGKLKPHYGAAILMGFFTAFFLSVGWIALMYFAPKVSGIGSSLGIAAAVGFLIGFTTASSCGRFNFGAAIIIMIMSLLSFNLWIFGKAVIETTRGRGYGMNTAIADYKMLITDLNLPLLLPLAALVIAGLVGASIAKPRKVNVE